MATALELLILENENSTSQYRDKHLRVENNVESLFANPLGCLRHGGVRGVVQHHNINKPQRVELRQLDLVALKNK